MNDRSREVFRRVVETYLQTGEPVGSRTLTRALSEQVSAATVRNVMQDLEYMGLLGSPHVSAGRVPTQLGLRMFVDGFLEVGDLTDGDRDKIQETLGSNSADVPALMSSVGKALQPFAERGLVSITGHRLEILPEGLPYASTVASLFDAHRQPIARQFSSAV